MIKLDSLTIKDPKPMAADTGYRILLEGTDGVFVNSFDPTDIIQAIKDLCIINA